MELREVRGIAAQPGISIRPLLHLLSVMGIITSESDSSVRAQENRCVLQNIMLLSSDFSLLKVFSKILQYSFSYSI